MTKSESRTKEQRNVLSMQGRRRGGRGPGEEIARSNELGARWVERVEGDELKCRVLGTR